MGTTGKGVAPSSARQRERKIHSLSRMAIDVKEKIHGKSRCSDATPLEISAKLRILRHFESEEIENGKRTSDGSGEVPRDISLTPTAGDQKFFHLR